MKHRENKFFQTLAYHVQTHEKTNPDDGFTLGGVMLADLRLLMSSSSYQIVQAYGQCSLCTQLGIVSDSEQLFCAMHATVVLRERLALLQQIAKKFGGADESPIGVVDTMSTGQVTTIAVQDDHYAVGAPRSMNALCECEHVYGKHKYLEPHNCLMPGCECGSFMPYRDQ